MADRDLDLTLLGATGFTGALTAHHLAAHAPAGLHWALAGRNRDKLTALRDELTTVDPRCADLELVRVDSSDRPALDALAARSRVVIGAVGPYLQHGEPLVAACAAAGTDYVDLTGEPEFVDRMYLAHHATAVASGARLVHACGFDTVPHDLGAWYAVQQLDPTRPITLRGVVRATGGVSGGTVASLLGVASRLREARAAVRERARVESPPAGRSSRAVTGRPHRDDVVGCWLLPSPTIDPQVIMRSGAALASYGPDFTYSHYAGIKRLPVLAGALVGVAAALGAAQVGPMRRAITRRMPAGSGPSDQTRAGAGFIVDFVGRSGGQRVHARVTGPDPYDVSGICLAEAALCLALDDNPPTAGQVTTAEAMAESLLARLRAAGLTFEVVAVAG